MDSQSSRWKYGASTNREEYSISIEFLCSTSILFLLRPLCKRSMFGRSSLKLLHATQKCVVGQRIIRATMTADTAESTLPRSQKRPFTERKAPRSKKVRKREGRGETVITHDDVLLKDLSEYMTRMNIDPSNVENTTPEQQQATVEITATSSTGDGIGREQKGNGSSQVYVVPFAVPGDVVRIKAYRHIRGPFPYTQADFIDVQTPSPDRDDSIIGCRYFAKCGGCQFQMLPYEKQLAQKRTVVEKAFRNFSQLPPELVPTVQNTFPSPLQYGFRTKLTPHFDGPPGPKRKPTRWESCPPIGFQRKDTGKTMDIEECPIGAEVLQHGLKRERKRVAERIGEYKNGATILLRESTRKRLRAEGDGEEGSIKFDNEQDTLYQYRDGHVFEKSCVSDMKGTSTDYVGDYALTAPANSFFQNNNSILPGFIDQIRQLIMMPSLSEQENQSEGQSLKFENLIDAYCGSGLFSITLANLFTRTTGIDIDPLSIKAAYANMEANAHLLPNREGSPGSDSDSEGVSFIAASAERLFESVKTFTPEQTVVILDPPRKGCDKLFLNQLLDFAPERIIYVSCNVHTQARDIGWLLKGGQDEDVDLQAAVEGRSYNMVSLRGFDFFPQTHHVEGVAVLEKRRPRISKTIESSIANGE